MLLLLVFLTTIGYSRVASSLEEGVGNRRRCYSHRSCSGALICEEFACQMPVVEINGQDVQDPSKSCQNHSECPDLTICEEGICKMPIRAAQGSEVAVGLGIMQASEEETVGDLMKCRSGHQCPEWHVCEGKTCKMPTVTISGDKVTDASKQCSDHSSCPDITICYENICMMPVTKNTPSDAQAAAPSKFRARSAPAPTKLRARSAPVPTKTRMARSAPAPVDAQAAAAPADAEAEKQARLERLAAIPRAKRLAAQKKKKAKKKKKKKAKKKKKKGLENAVGDVKTCSNDSGCPGITVCYRGICKMPTSKQVITMESEHSAFNIEDALLTSFAAIGFVASIGMTYNAIKKCTKPHPYENIDTV